MNAEVLKDPEKIQKVGDGHDQECATEGVTEGGLKDGDGHEDVILAVIAIGGGGSESDGGIDENGDGGDGVKRRSGSSGAAGPEPKDEGEVAGKTEEQGNAEEGGDRAPDFGEQEIGGQERDDDDEIESAKKQLLLTEGVRIVSAPVGDGPAPGSLVSTKRRTPLHVF